MYLADRAFFCRLHHFNYTVKPKPA